VRFLCPVYFRGAPFPWTCCVRCLRPHPTFPGPEYRSIGLSICLSVYLHAVSIILSLPVCGRLPSVSVHTCVFMLSCHVLCVLILLMVNSTQIDDHGEPALAGTHLSFLTAGTRSLGTTDDSASLLLCALCSSARRWDQMPWCSGEVSIIRRPFCALVLRRNRSPRSLCCLSSEHQDTPLTVLDYILYT
jgi:hypothetical protein